MRRRKGAHWDGEGRSFQRRGWGRWGSRKGGGGVTHDLFPPNSAREWALAWKPASREWCGTARTGCPGSLRLRGCFGRRRRNPGTSDHRQRRHSPREITTSAMAAGRRADRGGGALRTAGGGRQGAGGKRESTVCTLQHLVKRRSGCEAGADRQSVAADAPCHAASFMEWSLRGGGRRQSVGKGGGCGTGCS